MKKSRIEIHGHRGFRGHYPENSKIGFHKATELGVDVLEMDVSISKDHKVVVSHEPYINDHICIFPNTDGIWKNDEAENNFYKMTYEEIRKFDCGSKFLPAFPFQKKIKTCKPLLSEVFSAVDALDPEMRYNIEIKASPEFDMVFTPQPPKYVELVLADIHRKKVLQRTNLQSFDIRILKEIKKQEPKIKTALLIDKQENIDLKLDQLGYVPEILSPHFSLLTKANTNNYQSKGFKIIPWTVNTDADLLSMVKLKVNGVITDYPNRLIDILCAK